MPSVWSPELDGSDRHGSAPQNATSHRICCLSYQSCLFGAPGSLTKLKSCASDRCTGFPEDVHELDPRYAEACGTPHAPSREAAPFAPDRLRFRVAYITLGLARYTILSGFRNGAKSLACASFG